MPKCTINGTPVQVKDGATIIEAFYQSGADIAHYCWHPGLSVAGVCRMCMVEIEGQPKLQIACNTKVTEGMVVNNNSEKVKDSVKWVLDFHLINHPLDCPICDQAGECGLQEQYMKFGKYDPEMDQKKVKKNKAVSLGERVVLDTERCILCSRCVRFTEEVTKTNELHIVNRGDRSEIGTFDGKPMNNNYSLNTVDICPVGALTAKDFRFKQRVWFLKEANTVCPGCSTGCNVRAYMNKQGVYRLKPVHNADVNGYWMCDKGRETYKYTNMDVRLKTAIYSANGAKSESTPGSAAKQIAAKLEKIKEAGTQGKVAIVVTAQYTNEEYEQLFGSLGLMGIKNVYYWINNQSTFDTFDGILYRGDQNPNTVGLLSSLEKFGLNKTWDDLEKQLSKGEIDFLIVAGPENQAAYPDMQSKAKLFAQAKEVVWLTANPVKDAEVMKSAWFVPMKTYLEKAGTFVNYKGIAQKINVVFTVNSQALTLSEFAILASGMELGLRPVQLPGRVHNEYVHHRGSL